MSIKKISAIVIAGLMTIGVVAAFAQDAFAASATPEEAVTMRKEIMRTNGTTLRGAGALTGPEAVAAMQTLLNDFTNMPAVFPEGSIVGDSKALPAIWENWDAFLAIVETGKTAGIATAEAGDAAAYAAALQTIGGTCEQCHQQFRS